MTDLSRESSSPSTATQAATPTENVPSRRRGSYASRDLTTGSIRRNLWFLAWPQVIEQSFTIVDHIADLFWAGHLGAQSIAGLGVAQSYMQLAMTGRMGFDTAMRAMVGRAVGAGDVRSANHIAVQSFTLSALFAMLMMVIGIVFAEPMMRVLGVSNEVIAATADYMRVQMVSQVGVAFRMMSGAALQASGDTMTPMKSTSIMRVIHLALSPCLVFGLLFFPQWGLAGAGVATAIAQFVGASINFRALFTGSSRLHLTFRGYRPDAPLMWQIARLGAPAAVTSAERNIAQLMLIGIVTPFGDYVLAAYSLTRRTEMFANMAMGGMGQSAGILAAQNLGAKQPARARLAVKWALLYACLLLAAMGTLLYIFAEPVVAIFNEQPEMLGTAVEWLRIQVLGYFFLGVSTVLMQSFQSAGDNAAPMLVSLIAIWGVQQPLAVLLPGVGGLGEYGIAWAINVSLLARCIFFVPYFRWGPWMTKRVVAARGQKVEAAPSP